MLILWLLCHAQQLLGQSLPLPAVKQGKWFLIDGKREILLPSDYSSVGLFDKKGTATFSQRSLFGVLDIHGKELIAAKYHTIIPLGNGYYDCASANGTELIYATETEKQHVSCDSIAGIQPSWIYFEQDTNRFVVNTDQKRQMQLAPKQQIVFAMFDYLLIYSDTAHISLYGPKGEMISEDSVYPFVSTHYFDYHGSKIHLLVDHNGAYEIPAKAENTWVTAEKIHYSLNGTAYLRDRESRRLLVYFQGENIDPYDDKHYLVTRNKLVGVMDLSGKIIVQPKYSSLWRSEGYYRVYQNESAGLLDEHFREILPCNYKYFYQDREFIYTYSIIDERGLHSKLTGKQLLLPVYDRISIENNMIKAWRGSTLTILEITPRHEVKSRITLDNAITLKSKVYKVRRPDVDERLFSVGWFYDSIVTPDSTGFSASVSHKWGLKNANDSILLRPKQKQPVFIPGAPVSLLPTGSKQVKGIGTWDAQPDVHDPRFQTFAMINFSTGKLVRNFTVLDLDSSDFSRNGYARLAHAKGFAILRSDGTVQPLKHIDHSNETFRRVCYSGKEVLSLEKGAETIEIQSRLFNVQDRQQYGVQLGNKFYRHLKYEDARWNFLDKEGNALFRDSFTFAQRFYKQTAIVKSDAGWGVVRPDSVVVPLQYASVERVPQYSDTVFKVQAISGGRIYFDSLFHPLAESPGKFEKQKGNLALFSGKGTRIYGAAQKLIYEGNKSCYLHAFDRFSIKNKKVFEIYDGSGSLIGESAAKPDDFLSEDVFTSVSNGKTGLMSVNGDTLAPFVFASITKCGNVFLAEGKAQTHLYSSEGSLLLDAENSVLLVDSVSGNRALIAEGKIVFTDASGRKTGKLKSDLKFRHYFNGCLFSEQNGYTILRSDGTEMLADKTFSDILFLENGYCALFSTEKKWLLYDPEWKLASDALMDVKKIRSLGENVLSLQLRSGFALYDMETKTVYQDFSKISGDWQNGLLLVSTDIKRSRWKYISRNDFGDPFQRSFLRAKPFANGLACVADASGWTIIGTDGLPKSLPSYGELEQTGYHMFRMNALPTYGLIDSHGNTILPAVYEKITMLPDNLIQVVKDGQIGYYDYRGKVIYEISR